MGKEGSQYTVCLWVGDMCEETGLRPTRAPGDHIAYNLSRPPEECLCERGVSEG